MHLTINIYTDDSQIYLWLSWCSVLKNRPTKQEMQVQSLDLEDTLEKEMATPPSVLPGKSHGQKGQSGLRSVVSRSYTT